jgi:hypothetical protein
MVFGLVVSPTLASGDPGMEATLPKAAYRPGDVDGRFMVGLESGLFDVSRQFVTERDASVSRESGSTTLALSVGGTPSVVFGYGLHQDWLITGTLSASRRTVEDEDQQETTTDVWVSPAISYLFGQGPVRPFVGVQGRVAIRSGGLEHLGGGGGTHAGLRLEAGPRLSLEPRLDAAAFWSDNHYDYGTLQGDIQATTVYTAAALRVAAWF